MVLMPLGIPTQKQKPTKSAFSTPSISISFSHSIEWWRLTLVCSGAPWEWEVGQNGSQLSPHLCSPPESWLALPDFPDYHKWGFSVAALNNQVYVTGR